MKPIRYCILLLLGAALLTACSKEEDLTNDFVGLWQLQQTLEDGVDIALSDSAQMTKIIMDGNGLYRLYSGEEGIVRNGTWLFTPTERLDLTMDRKNNQDRHEYTKYEPCPVPFVIVSVSTNSFEIKYRNTVDERKRFVMFTPMDDDATYLSLVAQLDTTTNVHDKTALERQILDMDQKMVTYSFVFDRISE